MREQALEMGVDGAEGGRQTLAPFAVQAGNALTEALDRGNQVVALADEGGAAFVDFVRLGFGAEVDRAEAFPLLAVALEARVDTGNLRERRARLQPCKTGRLLGRTVERLADAGGDLAQALTRGDHTFLGAAALLAGLGKRIEGGVRRLVGGGERRFARGERVG